MSTCGCGGDSNGPNVGHSITEWRHTRASTTGRRRARDAHIDVADVLAADEQLVEHRERGRALRADRFEVAELAPPPRRARRRPAARRARAPPGRRRRRSVAVWDRSASGSSATARAGAAGSIRSPRSGTRATPMSSGRPDRRLGLVAEHPAGPVDQHDGARASLPATPSAPARRTHATGSRSTTVIVSDGRELALDLRLRRPTAAPRPGARRRRCRRRAAPSPPSRPRRSARPPRSRATRPGH